MEFEEHIKSKSFEELKKTLLETAYLSPFFGRMSAVQNGILFIVKNHYDTKLCTG